MILGAMLGLSLGLFFARDFARYGERLFTLMANRTAAVTVICWLWAGVFAGILQASGLVEAMVWLGLELDVSGAVFTVAVFITAALFAVSVGTGMGTVMGFTPIMYPAGVILGAEPAVLMGAIFSGAAFGDNLAPISDTTIVSATTQETDVGGVVRSRLKYVLIAAAISCVLFALFGASGAASAVDPAGVRSLLEREDAARSLWMLLPAGVVFVVALRGHHFIAALTAGIFTALPLGLLAGLFSWSDAFRVGTSEQGESTVEGFLVDGPQGFFPIIVLTLLLVTSIGLMAESGFLEAMMRRLEKTLARTVRGVELSIVALISFANLCVSVNTIAMITVGPLANELRKRHGIHPHRSANLLDTISCSFPYLLPYAATIPVAHYLQEQAHAAYDAVPVLSWGDEVFYIFYGMVLFPVMVIAVLTGYGRRKG